MIPIGFIPYKKKNGLRMNINAHLPHIINARGQKMALVTKNYISSLIIHILSFPSYKPKKEAISI